MEIDYVQSFLSRLFEGPVSVRSTAKAEPTDTDASKAITLSRTVEDGVTTTLLTQNDLSASVPVNATTSQFETPQAFVDAVLAFIADGDNDISVTDGVITNDRP